MVPDYSNLITEIRNLWKEVRRNATDIGRVKNRLIGNGDDTGTVLGRLKSVEGKVDTLMDLKKSVELIANRKNSVFLRVKDVVISIGVVVTIILSLKTMGII